MKRSELSARGLEKDQIDFVMEAHGADIELLKERHTEAVDSLKEKVKTATDEAKTLQSKVKELESAQPAEDLQPKLDALQAEYDKFKADTAEEISGYKTKIEGFETSEVTQKKRQAARADLLKRQVSADVLDDFLLDKLDFDAMELDGDDVKDADAYMKPYQERYAKYFGKVETKGAGVGNPPANNGGEKNPWLKENRNIGEQSRIFREDPQKARQLAAAAGVTI